MKRRLAVLAAVLLTAGTLQIAVAATPDELVAPQPKQLKIHMDPNLDLSQSQLLGCVLVIEEPAMYCMSLEEMVKRMRKQEAQDAKKKSGTIEL